MDKHTGSSKQKPRPCLRFLPVLFVFAALLSVFSVTALAGVYYPGDVNVDKVIDVSDAVLLSRFVAEDSDAAITRQGMINADANDDKNIDGDDCIMILKMIAKQLPMPPNPYTTSATAESTVTTSSTAATQTTSGNETTALSSANTAETAETTTVTSESTDTSKTAATETTVSTSQSVPEVTDKADMTADQVPYPLGVSISVLSGKTMPNEMLTVNYEIGNIIFAIFAEKPEETVIAIAFQDDIVGYYIICSEYTVPQGYRVREYRDECSDEVGSVYAVSVLRSDVSIRFDKLADRDDLDVLSKLNYYALNGLRAKEGLHVLTWHPELAKLARAHSVDMAENNFFEHYSSDGTSRKDRMLNAGIDYMTGGENIDRGQFDPFDALDGWLGSDVHRENLLSKEFTHIGVGFAYSKDADGYFYGTQDFCSFFPD